MRSSVQHGTAAARRHKWKMKFLHTYESLSLATFWVSHFWKSRQWWKLRVLSPRSCAPRYLTNQYNFISKVKVRLLPNGFYLLRTRRFRFEGRRPLPDLLALVPGSSYTFSFSAHSSVNRAPTLWQPVHPAQLLFIFTHSLLFWPFKSSYARL